MLTLIIIGIVLACITAGIAYIAHMIERINKEIEQEERERWEAHQAFQAEAQADADRAQAEAEAQAVEDERKVKDTLIEGIL